MINVVVLSLCLAAILIFKDIAADRTAELMDQLGSEGTGDATRPPPVVRTLGVGQNLVHEAVRRGREAARRQ